MRTRNLAIVRFTGGPHHGLVVEAPPDIAAELPDMDFTVLASGALVDLTTETRIRGARVKRPAERPAEPDSVGPPPAAVERQPAVPHRVAEAVLGSRPAPAMPVFRSGRQSG